MHPGRWLIASGLLVSALAACGDGSGNPTSDSAGGAAGSSHAATTATTGGGTSTSDGGSGTNTATGASGTSAQSGAGTGGAPGELCPGTAFFCDDFEQNAVGTTPAGAWDP